MPKPRIDILILGFRAKVSVASLGNFFCLYGVGVVCTISTKFPFSSLAIVIYIQNLDKDITYNYNNDQCCVKPKSLFIGERII